CGKFATDETDWRLAELLANIQFACQRYYFGAMAENYFENKTKEAAMNVQHRQRTIDALLLPSDLRSDPKQIDK
ncbi:MAG: hypothetical protein II555_05030, partial [Bacteroidales bacterium]|nr:hypothetical protein [Bacteroidales bacterium]